MFSREFLFCLFISYTPVCMWSALHLKEKVLWGRITWSGMGKQNTQARKVYSTVVPRAFTLGNEFSIGTAGKRNWFNSYAFVYFLSFLHKFSGPTILTGKDLGWVIWLRQKFFLSEPIIVIDFLGNFLQLLTPCKNFFVPEMYFLESSSWLQTEVPSRRKSYQVWF